MRWLSQGVCGQDWWPECDPQDTDWKQKARELSSDLHTCSHMCTYRNQTAEVKRFSEAHHANAPISSAMQILPFGVTLFFPYYLSL